MNAAYEIFWYFCGCCKNFSGEENNHFQENAYYKVYICIIINIIKSHVDPVMTVIVNWYTFECIIQAADGEPDRWSHSCHRHQPTKRVPVHVPIAFGSRRSMFRECEPSSLHLTGDLAAHIFENNILV